MENDMPKRTSLVLPDRSVQRLERLQELTGAGSATEVIRRALMTYESLAEHIRGGASFTVQKPGEEPYNVEFMIDV